MSPDPFDLDLQPGHGGVEFGKVSDDTEATANGGDDRQAVAPAASADVVDPTEAWIQRQNEQIKAAMESGGRGEIASGLSSVDLGREFVIRPDRNEIHGYGYQIVLPYKGGQGWQYSQGSTGWDRDLAIEFAKERLAGHKGRIEIAPMRCGWDPDVTVFDHDVFDQAVEIAGLSMLVEDAAQDPFYDLDQDDTNQLLAMLHETWLRWCEFHGKSLRCMHFAGPVITILAEDEAPGDLDAEDA
jgi:hypothetical protein